jgi:glycosyltransferase involved in cell wall biosynthesis
VAELRDGWFLWNRAILPDYPAWRAPIEARLESAVIREASRGVCVTQRMAHAFRDQYPDLPARRFAVVPNGFDPAQIGRPGPHKTEHFEVLHAGALYYGRPIGPFLLAAGRLASEDSGFAHRFRLRLVGSLDATASAEVACSPVAERVTFGGFLDHAATLEAERAADLLLLVANTTPGAEATVPGKLFEYLATGRPVLAIAPARSATAEVLERTGGGWLADASDPHAIYRQLSAAFQAHQSGAVCAANPAELAHFDRRRLAATLARVFDEVS